MRKSSNITVNELIYCEYLSPDKLVVIDSSDERIRTSIIHFINLLEGYIKQLDELKSEPITIIHILTRFGERAYESRKQAISRDLQEIREDLKKLILTMQRKHPYKYYPIPEKRFDDFDFEFRDTEIDHRELISYEDAVKLIVALATCLKAKLEVPIGRINQFTYEFFEAEPAYDVPEWRGFIVADESDFDTQDSIIPTEKQTIDKFGDISPRGESYDCQDNDESLEGGQEVGNSARKQIKNLRQEPNSIGFLEGCIPKSQPIREEELQKTPGDNRSKTLQQSDQDVPIVETLCKEDELEKTPGDNRSKTLQQSDQDVPIVETLCKEDELEKTPAKKPSNKGSETRQQRNQVSTDAAAWCKKTLVRIVASSKSDMLLGKIYKILVKRNSGRQIRYVLPVEGTISKYLKELCKTNQIELTGKKYKRVPTQVKKNETEVK